MADTPRAPEIRGKTIRFKWTGGPTKGMTHEHVFHEDGAVEYRSIDETEKGKPAKEKEYAAMKVAEDIFLVSYLAASSYTLTVALNFRSHKIFGIASSAKEWFPIEGTLEVVE
jgi:molybdenum cofactor biosynthesis protein MoaF